MLFLAIYDVFELEVVWVLFELQVIWNLHVVVAWRRALILLWARGRLDNLVPYIKKIMLPYFHELLLLL